MSGPPFERMITFTRIVAPTMKELQFIPQSGRTCMFIKICSPKKSSSSKVVTSTIGVAIKFRWKGENILCNSVLGVTLGVSPTSL